MRRTKLGIDAGVAVGFTAFAADAHHSAIRVDLTIRDNMVTGIVKEFVPANPHTKIVLEVTDEKGTRDIEYEGHSRNNYFRSGWREGMVKPGDTITADRRPDPRRQRRRLRLRRDHRRRHALLTALHRLVFGRSGCPAAALRPRRFRSPRATLLRIRALSSVGAGCGHLRRRIAAGQPLLPKPKRSRR